MIQSSKVLKLIVPFTFLFIFLLFVGSAWVIFYKVKMGELLIKEGGLFHSIL